MKWLTWLIVPLLAWGEEEFSFDARSFEKKRFELQSYLRSDNTIQWQRDPSRRTVRTSDELNLQTWWDEEPLNLYADASIFYRNDNRTPHDQESLLNAFRQRFGDERESLDAGKKVLRWGKGYAYSPLAFFERPKDPVYPDLSREGFWMAHAQLTRTPDERLLSTYTLDLLYLPDIDENRDHFRSTDSRGGAKLYLLSGQSDIDLIVAENAFGADISSDIGNGLELHADFGAKGGEKSSLLGMRYQSPSDLTIIAEWFRTYENLSYRYLKVTQKEPLNMVYSSLYALWLDQEDSSAYRLLTGGTYDFKNGFTLDLAYIRTDIADGAKIIVYYYF